MLVLLFHRLRPAERSSSGGCGSDGAIRFFEGGLFVGAPQSRMVQVCYYPFSNEENLV